MQRLVFDPQDPFPNVSLFDLDYEVEKSHAARVDQWLGLETEKVESTLVAALPGARDREFWIGKSVQTFSTPYTELRAMLDEIQPRSGATVADLGAGYGRMAHVLERHFPGVRFQGYEFVEARQIEGQRAILRAGLAKSTLAHQDVTTLDFSKLDVTYYFMYDFGSRADVEIAVENLKSAAGLKPITVVARGGRSRDVIEKRHPWLSQVVTPMHRRHYSIYRSAE